MADAPVNHPRLIPYFPSSAHRPIHNILLRRGTDAQWRLHRLLSRKELTTPPSYLLAQSRSRHVVKSRLISLKDWNRNSESIDWLIHNDNDTSLCSQIKEEEQQQEETK
mmetsp:Transcript_34008/g.74580  ORF Transcript_34008/g.74580 Transcript_34008/m.74580 type:complete len:109 (-) Transcript_34008:650-976(-)